ncbi:hypothetical protein [Paenibacillus sp. 203]|uniref:hypothetical protein n=1 Tax=unclassified Paenibacillus TaxID=185978 RepID=UPI00300B87AB
MEIELLVIGKRVGLSFSEMNELRVTDLLDMAHSFTGNKPGGSREAVQEDIDSFYSR